MNDIHSAVREILGEEPRALARLDSGNNDVVRVETSAGTHVLKRFRRNQYGAHEREIGMRQYLGQFSPIAFPRILGQAELDGIRYILMEDIAGERLDQTWSRDHRQAGDEMSTLGRMLATLHTIPVAGTNRFLEREEVLFSERYFAWMVETMAQSWQKADWSEPLRRCYDVVTAAPLEQVIIHGDFGPHQVVVDSQGQWVLMDFEYAALGAFADDLGGTEVRLERREYPSIEGVLQAYHGVRGTLAQYEPVRSAYKAYNLLAILTYCLAHRGQNPSREEIDRLERLLESL